MTRVELDRKFKKAGWNIVHGSGNDKAISPSGQIVPLPRHRGDIPTGTAQKILKDAGLK